MPAGVVTARGIHGRERVLSKQGRDEAHRATATGDFLAVYGELLSDPDVIQGPRIQARCELIGGCWIPGLLFDLGEYPGLVEGDGEVLGELYQVRDPTVFTELDYFQGYDVGDQANSEYVRRRVRLTEPPLTAWVYVYNRPVEDAGPVRSGDWRGYLAERLRLR
jgi:gamma-glutamylcyclotransferase (GGCT)/AIG2-like uncharacterized protein YtfP